MTLLKPYLLRSAWFAAMAMVLAFCGQLWAQQRLPDTGVNILDAARWKKINYEKQPLGKTSIEVDPDSGHSLMTVETFSHPTFIYELSLKLPLIPRNLYAGETVLLGFSAKTLHAQLETGEARTRWLLNVSADPRERIEKTLNLSSDWKEYFVLFPISKDVSARDLAMILQFGFPPQKFLVRNLSVWIYGKEINANKLPKTDISYQGMEPNAPWREIADQRIEKIRKRDFELEFFYNGKPLENIPVQIVQKKHHFGWGAALSARELLEDPEQLQHFTAAFNLAVFENDLKIKAWTTPGRKELTLRALDLLKDHEISVKGHVLVWPGFRYLPSNFLKHKNNPRKITAMLASHLNDIIYTTKGRISHWDVVNEAYTNKDLQEITGSEAILFNSFLKLFQMDPGAGRFVNEYGIISKGGLDKAKQEWYKNFIRRIDENTNGLVDGIGIQCHMGSDLTPPVKVLQILDEYAAFGKKISISEFTLSIDDPQVRISYTRDFLRAVFSHPSVEEVLFWGYHREKADIFTSDWQQGTMGKAFFDLVHGEWKTAFTAETSALGKLSGRGFLGTYEYRFVVDGRLIQGTFELLPENETSFLFNHDQKKAK